MVIHPKFIRTKLKRQLMYAFMQDVPINDELYAKIRANLGAEPLPGLLFPFVVRREDGLLRYIDVWESAEACGQTFEKRIHPAEFAAFKEAKFRPSGEPSRTEMPVVALMVGATRRSASVRRASRLSWPPAAAWTRRTRAATRLHPRRRRLPQPSASRATTSSARMRRRPLACLCRRRRTTPRSTNAATTRANSTARPCRSARGTNARRRWRAATQRRSPALA